MRDVKDMGQQMGYSSLEWNWPKEAIIIIIIIEGLSLLQSIPPTTADKQTQAQKRRGKLTTWSSLMIRDAAKYLVIIN